MNEARNFDVIVIGGGPVGLATAFHLAKRKVRVLVLEQFTFGNQLGSSAGVSRQFRIPYPVRYMVKLAHQALPFWEELQGFTGSKLLDRVGTLWFGDPSVHTSEGNIAEARSALDAEGIPYINLDVEELEKKFLFRNTMMKGKHRHEDARMVRAHCRDIRRPNRSVHGGERR